MGQEFLPAPVAKLGTPVCRTGLSATYRPGRGTIHRALDEGINYFFYLGIDNQMVRTLRETIGPRREQYVLATGSCNWIVGQPPLRKTLERRQRQIRTDYIDLFHFQPKFATELLRDGTLDAAMIRYSAGNRGGRRSTSSPTCRILTRLWSANGNPLAVAFAASPRVSRASTIGWNVLSLRAQPAPSRRLPDGTDQSSAI